MAAPRKATGQVFKRLRAASARVRMPRAPQPVAPLGARKRCTSRRSRKRCRQARLTLLPPMLLVAFRVSRRSQRKDPDVSSKKRGSELHLRAILPTVPRGPRAQATLVSATENEAALPAFPSQGRGWRRCEHTIPVCAAPLDENRPRPPEPHKGDTMKFQKLTPNLVVRDVAASMEFYRSVLGFQPAITVPEQPPYVFGSVTSGSVEIFFNDQKTRRRGLSRARGQTHRRQPDAVYRGGGDRRGIGRRQEKRRQDYHAAERSVLRHARIRLRRPRRLGADDCRKNQIGANKRSRLNPRRPGETWKRFAPASSVPSVVRFAATYFTRIFFWLSSSLP